MDALADQTQTNVFFLTNWEKDTWKRIYFHVHPKKATLSYTLNRKEALQKKYPKVLENVHECSIKHPKSSTDQSNIKRSTTLTDTEEKNRPKSPLGMALKSIRFTKSGYDSSADKE